MLAQQEVKVVFLLSVTTLNKVMKQPLTFPEIHFVVFVSKHSRVLSSEWQNNFLCSLGQSRLIFTFNSFFFFLELQKQHLYWLLYVSCVDHRYNCCSEHLSGC